VYIFYVKFDITNIIVSNRFMVIRKIIVQGDIIKKLYSDDEKTDIILIVGECSKNAIQPARLVSNISK
jgi:hypothetical protein